MILSFPQLNLGVEIPHPISMRLTLGGHAIFQLSPNPTCMKHSTNSFIVYGVPSRLINDNAKELTQGKFSSVTHQAHCHMDLTQMACWPMDGR